MDLAVAPQTGGAHGDGLYHRAVAAHAGTCGVNRRPSVAQQGHIRGGAADITDQRMCRAGHPPRPDNRGRRPAENRFNRSRTRLCRRDQCPIAAYDHQRGRHADVSQHILGAANQPVDHPDEPRIQHRRQRPFRPVELGRQLMRGRHRPARHLRHKRSNPLFVDRVARRKLTGDREPADLRFLRGQKRDQRVFVQRGKLCACVVMSAAQDQIGITVQGLCQPVRLKVTFFETDIDQRHAPALPFDQCIGRQRGGQRRHSHLTR